MHIYKYTEIYMHIWRYMYVCLCFLELEISILYSKALIYKPIFLFNQCY